MLMSLGSFDQNNRARPYFHSLKQQASCDGFLEETKPCFITFKMIKFDNSFAKNIISFSCIVVVGIGACKFVLKKTRLFKISVRHLYTKLIFFTNVYHMIINYQCAVTHMKCSSQTVTQHI